MRSKKMIKDQINFIAKKKSYRLLNQSFKAILWSIQHKKKLKRYVKRIYDIRDNKKAKVAWVKWIKNMHFVGNYYAMIKTWRHRRMQIVFDKIHQNYMSEKRINITIALVHKIFFQSYNREYKCSFLTIKDNMMRIKRSNTAYENLVSQIRMRKLKTMFSALYSNKISNLLIDKNKIMAERQTKLQRISE